MQNQGPFFLRIDTSFDTNSLLGRLGRHGGHLHSFIKTEGGGLLDARYNVAVDVQCGSRFGMAQTFLNNFGVFALAKHQRRMGMSGIVESVTLEPGAMHNLCERAAEAPGKYWGTITIAEDRGVVVDFKSLEEPVRFLALPKETEY